jgi:hypothetical protein
LFDLQHDRKYVIAAHSVHPSGVLYTPWDTSPIAECPAWLSTWVKETLETLEKENSALQATADVENNVKPSPAPASQSSSLPWGSIIIHGKAFSPVSKPVTKEQFENWLTLHNEDFHAPKYEPMTRNHPARWKYIRADRCPWQSEHTNKEGDKDFAIYFCEDGRLGVKCQHSHTKTWAQYRDFLQERTGYNIAMKTGAKIGAPAPIPVDKVKGSDGNWYYRDANKVVIGMVQ